MKVTERDLIIALQQTSLSHDDNITGFTMYEIVIASGVSDYKARVIVKRLIKMGIMRFVGKRRGINITGDVCRTPVYRFIDGLDIANVLELLESNDIDGIGELVKQAENGND